MDTSFWLQKWEKNELGFHKSEANPLLVQHFETLSLTKGSRVFLPLCGKTLDIAWLLAHGYRVAGAELVEMAIEQLFMELGVEPKISKYLPEPGSETGEIRHYSAPNIDIFVGNIFDLSRDLLGPVDAIYDRAALVALPESVRDRYTAHLQHITNRASQLLVTYAYDQTLMTGPPFSVSHEEVDQHYGDDYEITLRDSLQERLYSSCNPFSENNLLNCNGLNQSIWKGSHADCNLRSRNS